MGIHVIYFQILGFGRMKNAKSSFKNKTKRTKTYVSFSALSLIINCLIREVCEDLRNQC